MEEPSSLQYNKDMPENDETFDMTRFESTIVKKSEKENEQADESYCERSTNVQSQVSAVSSRDLYASL